VRDTVLDGIRVLDLGTALAGPVCATILGEFGAEVIKVERPGTGDSLRTFGPSVGDVPLWWMIEGRNKLGITLDISLPEGQQLARELAVRCDVVVENFRPGTMERWGLSASDLRSLAPRLIYVSVSGFGQTGPYRGRGAYDRVGQAYAGLTYLSGHPDQPPVKPGIGVTDYSTAITAALGAMLALYARDTSADGVGQHVDAALTDTILRMYHYFIPSFELTGAIPERTGNATESMVPAECFQTQDGRWVMIAAGSDGVFRRLAVEMGRPELADDPRFLTNTQRSQNVTAIHAIIRDWTAEMKAETLLARLDTAGVPVAPLYDAGQVARDPHFREREMVVEVKDPRLGTVSMQGVTPKLDLTPGTIRSTGPELGADNDAVYRGLLGHSSDELERWRQLGVI
jgi:formyl-CoA transferase